MNTSNTKTTYHIGLIILSMGVLTGCTYCIPLLSAGLTVGLAWKVYSCVEDIVSIQPYQTF